MDNIGAKSKNSYKSLHGSKDTVDNSLSSQSKDKIKKLIEKDNLFELIVTLDSQKTPLFADISSNSRWMMTHHCCRWDAYNCLQF